MQPRPRSAPLVAVSIILALVAVVLLGGAAWGVNVGLWSIAVAVACAWRGGLTRSTKALGGAAVAFALLFTLRDSNALKIANGLAIAFCVGAILLPRAAESLRDSPLARLLAAPFAGLVYLSARACALLMRARTKEQRGSKRNSAEKGGRSR